MDHFEWNPRSMPRRRLLLSAALAPFATGCASSGESIVAPTPNAARPRVVPGDVWRYSGVNRYNDRPIGDVIATVAQSGPDGLKLDLRNDANEPLGQEIYADAWTVTVDRSYDMLQAFETPMPMLPTRLQVGASQTDSSLFQVPGASAHLDWTQWMNVLAWERVRVPAGDFECLRVRRVIRFRHSDSFRQRSERWDTIWYAPAVDRWVQREWTGYYYAGGRSGRRQEDWTTWQLTQFQTSRSGS